jgi:hypothetical protein
MMNQLLRHHREEIAQILRYDISGFLSLGIKDVLAMAQVIAAGSNVRSEAVRSLLLNLSSLLQPVATLPEPLRSGVATWMKAPMDDYRTALRGLLTRGVSASLSEHVAVTRAILDAGVSKYVQINQFAYDVEHEWSRDWKEFLLHIKEDKKTIEYIVFASRDYLESNAGKLRGMNDYIKKCKGTLLICDKTFVSDSVGNVTVDDNLELFDDSVVKTQSSSPSGYRGGITLTMSLAEASDRPDLIRLITMIQESATPYGQE